MGCYLNQDSFDSCKSKDEIILVLDKHLIIYEEHKKRIEKELQNKLTEYETLISDTQLFKLEIESREILLLDRLKEGLARFYQTFEKDLEKQDYVRQKIELFNYLQGLKIKESINNNKLVN
jgi:hypothetical protein